MSESKESAPTAPTAAQRPNTQPLATWVLKGKDIRIWNAWKLVQMAHLEHRGVWESVLKEKLVSEKEKNDDAEALFVLMSVMTRLSKIRSEYLQARSNCGKSYKKTSKAQSQP